jgi:hypothetical protein
MPGFSSEAALIDEVRERLLRRFSRVPQDEITASVAQAHARFTHSRVRDFVPLLVERRAVAELAKELRGNNTRICVVVGVHGSCGRAVTV